MGVLESAGLRQCLLYTSPSLIKITEVRRGHGEVREHPGVVVHQPSTAAPTAAMRRITKAVTLFQELAGGNELPKPYVGRPS
jgi:hypothetical protein